MKIPFSVLDINGNPAKGCFVLRGSNGEELKEYGSTSNGTNSICYVLTSATDIITVHQKLGPGVAEFVDLQVDGILRQIKSTVKPEKDFNASFNHVWYQEKLSSGRGLGGIKSVKMEVQPRNAVHDKVWNGQGTPSDVGSLKILLLRSKTGGTSGGSDMGPAFNNHTTWWALNKDIDPMSTAPPFEVGFSDKRLCTKVERDRATTRRVGSYETIGSLQFHLRSTAALQAQGFVDVPDYYPSAAAPPKATKVKKEEAKTSKKGILPPTSFMPANEETMSGSHGLSIEGSIDPLVAAGRSANPQIEGVTGQRLSQSATDGNSLISPQRTSRTVERTLSSTAKDAHDVGSTAAVEQDGHMREEGQPKSVQTPNILEMPQSLRSMLVDFETGLTVEEVPEHPREPEEVGRSPIKVEFRESDIFADLENRKKGMVLLGLSEAPAHRAWLERASTEATQSRSTSSDSDKQSQLPVSNTLHSSTPSFNNLANTFLLEHYQFSPSADHDLIQNLSIESQISLTPPPSISKPRLLMLVDAASKKLLNGPKKMQTIMPDTLEQNEPIPGDYQVATHTQNRESQVEAMLENGKTTKPDMMYNTYASPSGLNIQYAPPSPTNSMKVPRAFSEAPTELATEEEIEAARQSSFQLALAPELHTSTTQQYLSWPRRVSKSPGPHAPDNPLAFGAGSPILGSETAGMEILAQNMENPGIAAAPLRLNWQTRSSANEPFAEITKLRDPADAHVANRTPQSDSPNLMSPSRATNPRRLINFSVEKRKADSIIGSTDGEFARPHKTLTSPSSMSSAKLQSSILAAQARLEAAKHQKQELDKALETAMLIQRQKVETIKDLNETAERLERENEELQAKIAAIYGN